MRRDRIIIYYVKRFYLFYVCVGDKVMLDMEENYKCFGEIGCLGLGFVRIRLIIYIFFFKGLFFLFVFSVFDGGIE